MNSKLLILALTLGLLSGFGAGFEGGSGTSGDPYQISTCQQLQDIEVDLSANYELVGDINCTESKNWNSEKGFKPLGNSTNGFTGVLDGNNHLIKGLFIDRDSEDFNALFGYTGASTMVKDLKLEDATVRGSLFTAVIAGRNRGNLQNISVDGDVYGANANTGGLVGLNYGNISLTTVKIALESDSFRAGGITGGNREGGRIENSKVFGSISGQNYVGGLAGVNSFKINNSSSYANIDGTGRVGGLAGYTDDSEADISQSSSAGTVNGSSDVGGLVGDHTNSKIIDSYSTSNVMGETNVGGLIGRLFAADLSSTFSTGEVTGSSLVGGLIGRRSGSFPGTINDSYWDVNSSGQSTSNGGTGLTTSDMIGSGAGANMAGFDFQDTWSTQSFYYPRLQWMELGSGTESDPFMIYNCRELQALNNDLDAYYELAGDVDCSDTVNWDNGKGFYPIARDTGFNDGFGGSLDGANRKISGLYINRPTELGSGLFGKIRTGNVQNVNIDSFNITGTSLSGTLSGMVQESSQIDKVSVVNSDVYAVRPSGDSRTGGAFGRVSESVIQDIVVKNTSIDGADYYLGGVVGTLDGSFARNMSSFNIAVVGTRFVGGIFGEVDECCFTGSLAINSYAYNSSLTGESRVGGISGSLGSDGISEISNASVKNTRITNSGSSGGIVPFISSDGAVVNVVSVNNTIDSECGLYDCNEGYGGVSGRVFGQIKNSYSARNRFLGDYANGLGILAGRLKSDGQLNDSYWDDDKATVSGAIGQNSGSSSNLIGLTNSEMQGCNSVQNMNLFDFENTWIAQSNDYPALRFFSSEGLSCDLASPPLAPTLLLPLDGSSQVPVTTNLSVTAEGTGLQNITFYRNNSGADSVIGSALNVNASNSEVAQLEWSGLNPSSLYEWYAVAENSAGSAYSNNWNFTTEQRPEVLGYSPSDGSNTPVNPDLNVTVSDDISNDIDVSYYDSSDNLIGEVTGLNSGVEGSLDISADSFGSGAGQTYEWYVVLETDSTASINTSNSSSFPDYWSFTTQDSVDISISPEFVDGINLNNGSADVGTSVLEFNIGNDQGASMSSAAIDIDGVQEASFTDIQNDSDVEIDISSLGIDQDRPSVPWSIEVTEGVSTETVSGVFSTHTVELTGEASDSSHDSVNFYYSETNSTDKGDYRVLTSVDSSDTSPVVVSSANRELDSGLSDEHCFTAAASRSGLESGISNPVCVGGDIP